jgi:hypothetical protein
LREAEGETPFLNEHPQSSHVVDVEGEIEDVQNYAILSFLFERS